MTGYYYMPPKKAQNAAAKAVLNSFKAPLVVGGAAYLAKKFKKGYLPKSSLSGEGFRGSAAPIQGKSISKQQNIKKAQRRRKKCSKMVGKKLSEKVCSIEHQLKDLKRMEDASLGQLSYNLLSAFRVVAPVAEQNGSGFDIITTTRLENVLAQTKYWDSTTSAFVTNDSAAGTSEKTFLFDHIGSTLTVRNNYQSDCEVLVYLMKPRGDTTITPGGQWANAIADDEGNVTSLTQYGSVPTMFSAFNELWTAKRVALKVLAPGESTSVYHSEQNIEYNPSLVDTHNQTYQRDHKACQWYIIVRGTISHDTVQNQQGIIGSGVDCKFKTVYKLKYNAGQNFSYVYYSDNMAQTFTNGAVQSHQPIPDNTGYAVA